MAQYTIDMLNKRQKLLQDEQSLMSQLYIYYKGYDDSHPGFGPNTLERKQGSKTSSQQKESRKS